jgi:hypothetical protein
MAIVLVVLFLFGFVGFGVGSGSTSTGDILKAPPRATGLHARPRPVDPCGNPRWHRRAGDHRQPRPLRNCALRSAARP